MRKTYFSLCLFLVVFILLALVINLEAGIGFFSSMEVDLKRFDWDGVAGISNVLMVFLNLVLVVGIVFSYESIKESSRARIFQVLESASQRIDMVHDDIKAVRGGGVSPGWNLEDFKVQYTKINNKLNYNKTELDKSINGIITLYIHNIPYDAANNASKTFERLAFFALSGLIPEKYFRDLWGPLFVDVWLRLEPWIIAKRIFNNESPFIETGAFSRKDLERLVLRFAKEVNYNPEVRCNPNVKEYAPENSEEAISLRKRFEQLKKRA